MWKRTLEWYMSTELLSEKKKYEEHLQSREKALTGNQKHQLQKIAKVETFLNRYEQELSEDLRQQVFAKLRRRQIEILTNEVDKPWKQFLDSLPDEVSVEIGIF